jgi:hypothetical protein
VFKNTNNQPFDEDKNKTLSLEQKSSYKILFYPDDVIQRKLIYLKK